VASPRPARSNKPSLPVCSRCVANSFSPTAKPVNTARCLACEPGTTSDPGASVCTSPALTFSGIRTAVPEEEVLDGGFSVCYQDLYANTIDETKIQADCNGDVLMLACRPVGSNTYSLAAMGLRDEVLLPVAATSTASHVHNNVQWYFTEDYSMGFAPEGATISRTECDNGVPEDADKRLCWHTIPVGGFRCGVDTFLNSNPGWERIVLQRAGTV
jgi:hypothetical protein